MKLGIGAVAFGAHSVRQPKVYSAGATVMIDNATPAVLTSVQEVVPVGGRSYWNDDFYEKQYLVIKSREVAARAAELLGLDPPPGSDDLSRATRGRYRVLPQGRTPGVVRITVEDTDPEVTSTLANAVAAQAIRTPSSSGWRSPCTTQRSGRSGHSP